MSIGIGLGLQLGRSGNPFNLRALPSQHLFVDFTALALSDGTRIASATDQSGAGHDLAQATAGKQPAFTLNSINGRAAALFDPVRVDGLLTSVFTASPEPRTVFLVAKTPSTTPAATQYLFEGSGGTARSGVLIGTGRTISLVVAATVATSAAITNGTPVVIVATINGASSALRVNGVQTAGDTGTAASPTAWNVGSRYGGVSTFDGPIAKVIVCAASLSAALIRQAEVALGNEYGISV